MAANFDIADEQHNSEIEVRDNVVHFSDGTFYILRRRELLKEALHIKYFPAGRDAHTLPSFNHNLTKVGYSAMKTCLYTVWYGNHNRMNILEDLHDRGLAMNTYQAYMAEETGLFLELDVCGLSVQDLPQEITADKPEEWAEWWSGDFGTKAKATAIEALVGAVFLDSNENCAETREVMRRLGFYWPQSREQERTLRGKINELRNGGRILTRLAQQNPAVRAAEASS